MFLSEMMQQMVTCLLAKTRRAASLSSSSFNILFNSSFASFTRSLSFESTTKIKPGKRMDKACFEDPHCKVKNYCSMFCIVITP